MQSFLKKLESLAEQWLNDVDHHSQPITVQIMTGAVFTHSDCPPEYEVEWQILHSSVVQPPTNKP